MTVPHIVFLDSDSLPAGTVLRPARFEHDWTDHRSTTPDETGARIKDASFVITGKVKIDSDVLSGTDKLRMIAVPGTGVDHIDLRACERRGVAVTNVPDYALHSVPEHTIAMLFALRRNLLAYHDAVRGGRWERADRFYFLDYPIRDVHGATMAIVGAGRIGRAVGRLAQALGMTVIYTARKGERVAAEGFVVFEQALEQADVVSLHCPLTALTHHLIGADEFVRMARRPLLINTSRGRLVDEAALAQALLEGRLSGAALDVASEEPPTEDHPFRSLRALPNFLLTPHIAWGSEGARYALAEQLMVNVDMFEAGEPRNCVRTTRQEKGT